MKFYYKESSQIRKGKMTYIEEDYSFYFEKDFLNRDYGCDASVLLNDLCVEISVDCVTNRALFIAGYSDKAKWIEAKLDKPNYCDGELYVQTDMAFNQGIGYSYKKIDGAIYFDKDKKICAIGNPLTDEITIGIQFATNTVAILNMNGELKAIYLFLE